MQPYIFDNSSTAEYQRLDLMSKILDPHTRAHLLSLGLRDGWNCLELGGGNGSMAECLREKVAPTGAVTSVEINPKLIRLVPAQNLTVLEADLRTADLSAAEFDLVMCRAMLHQIAEHASSLLAKMAAAVKPGGLALCLRARLQSCALLRARSLGKSLEWHSPLGPHAGSRLVHRPPITVHGPISRTRLSGSFYIPADHPRNHLRCALLQISIEMIRERILSSGLVDEQTLNAASAILSDPDLWTQCWMLTSVWLRKPCA